MSISKRLRFEVFKRHGFACAYCGRKPPKVILEADHRVPRSLGGEDVIENLVAACWDCNRGKGPVSLESGQMEEWECLGYDSWADWMVGTCIADFPEIPEVWCWNDRSRFNLRMSMEEILIAAAELPSPTTYPELDREPF